MTMQEMDFSGESRVRPRKQLARNFTTVKFPPSVFRQVKALARANEVSIHEQTLRLCAIALKTEQPGYSPPLSGMAKEMVDKLKTAAEEVKTGERRSYPAGILLDAARMIGKLATQVVRLKG